MSDWITTKEAGDLLGVNIRTIQRYVASGKLKAKIVSGKNHVKKDLILKIKEPKASQGDAPQPQTQNGNMVIPEGYLLIDRQTLESLREQINKLTDSVKEMQLTQKLLIEKGLNLNKENDVKMLSATDSVKSQDAIPEIITTPIESVAQAHEEFFGKNKSKGLSAFWLLILTIAGIAILITVVNFLANNSI